MDYLSLYIHVPFCAAKCDYCAFYSEPGASAKLKRQYLGCLRDQLAAVQQEEELASVFIGGGTPTLLEAGELGELLGAIRSSLRLASSYEWTVEANPDSLTPAKVETLARYGVNRISLGVQSFQPRLRMVLGRRGELRDLGGTLKQLRQAGIGRQNLDFIFAIPGQGVADWREDLSRAMDLGVEHISAYALTVEEGTRLAGRTAAEGIDEDLFEAMWDATDEVLEREGLRRYEISNFARPGAECRHNLAIWYGATYLGCGPAATSFDGTMRWTQPASLRDWLAGVAPEQDLLSPEERAREILAFGFRTVAGWRWPDFRNQTGFDAHDLRGEELGELVEQGLLAPREDGLAPTREGLLLNDSVISALL